VVRRRLTVRRLDPWSVLKFGIIANLALLAIGLLVAGVVWFFVDRLDLVDQACSIALDVGFTECGINAGNLFRAFILLGLLWVVVQTAVFVFLAFLHNLIADLTGGLALTVIDDTPTAAPARADVPARRVTTASTPPSHDGGPVRPGAPVARRVEQPPHRDATPAPPRRDTTAEPTRPHEPVSSGDQRRPTREPATGPAEDDGDLFGGR
jgi:hypothetical protein